MIWLIVASCTITLAGGFVVGVALGTLAERERAARRVPAPHEASAAEAVVLGLRGPLPSRPDPSLTERVPRRGPA